MMESSYFWSDSVKKIIVGTQIEIECQSETAIRDGVLILLQLN